MKKVLHRRKTRHRRQTEDRPLPKAEQIRIAMGRFEALHRPGIARIVRHKQREEILRGDPAALAAIEREWKAGR